MLMFILGHLNNLDYGICIEAESGFCGIEYSMGDSQSFSLTNKTEYFGDDSSPPVVSRKHKKNSLLSLSRAEYKPPI